jgi:hypothetical protein
MALPPLTHHEIIDLIEPFTRRGRHVDLAASDRIERRIAFKPIEHTGTPAALSGLREILQLESRSAGSFRLTRRLTIAGGLEAILQAEGAHPGELLTHVEAVPAERQFATGEGFVLAQSHRLEPPAGASAGGTVATQMVLTEGVAQVGGITLKLRATTVRGYPADIELLAAPGDSIELPEDLLAVIGWDWARLIPEKERWTSKLRVRGREPLRSRRTEIKLEKTVAHLARTLAEPPSRFHRQWFAARWGVAFRRAIPLLAGIGLMAGALAVPSLHIPEGSPIRLLIFNSPTILIALAFCMQELPRLEIPPLPRRLRVAAWRKVADAA